MQTLCSVFASMRYLEKQNIAPSIDNYEILYRGNLPTVKRSVPQPELLEQLYQKFNCAQPMDYHGHSLSVSDVILLNQAGKISAHYVDSIGFRELSGFQDTIHEGVTARALEKKGIISDRCELNRQIKADNALLRELKSAVRKLMEAVENTIPAFSEAMEKLRENMFFFRYQLNHIAKGKRSMRKYIKSVSPELERYTGLVQQLKDKTKERKNLLAEKKETPFYQLPKLHDLSRHIAELTEELEELKSEKAALLNTLDCADDARISEVKKQIVTMETALKKLEEQESKYAAELEDALKQYADLKAQAADVDAVELMDARLDIRPDRERSAAEQVKAAYGEKYDPLMMYDSKRDVADLLNEEAETRSVRDFLRQKQKAQQTRQQRKPKRHEQER